jgi:hypothetical protein
MDLRDRDHEVVQRVIVARHDRRHRLRDGDGGRDRIGGLVRHRAMAADTVTWISNVSTAAMIGPGVVRICPFQPRHVVDGIDAADAEAVHDALSHITPAPPPFSSAGWKISATLPAKFRVSARYFAAPSSIVVCPSWPQACILPGVVEACAAPVASMIGSASISARSPMTGPRPALR